jgi:2-C-methyl-D-erythritol 4-phosphate cytidylyltransferase
MGTDKLMLPLGPEGVPLLQRTVQAFVACGDIVEIILICPAERAARLTLPENCLVLPGGAQRQDSVWAGLQAATQPWVAVHDGARPLISPEMIRQTIATAVQTGAAALARQVTETLKRANLAQEVLPGTSDIDRDQLWSMETPQVFSRQLLQKAYAYVQAGNYRVTDEVSAIQLLGHSVKLVANPFPNLKITYPPDLALAEQLLRT